LLADIVAAMVDEPMIHFRGRESHFRGDLVQHTARACGHKQGEQGSGRVLVPLGSFRPGQGKGTLTHLSIASIEARKKNQNPSALPRNETKNEKVFRQLAASRGRKGRWWHSPTAHDSL